MYLLVTIICNLIMNQCAKGSDIMKKKMVIILAILLIVLTITCIILLSKNSKDTALEGRWTSTRDSLIRVIKEYKDGQPVYANDNIVEYWLDLKKDGKYVLIERGKYNIDSNNKIYFDSDDKNFPSNSTSYIWICEVEGENLHNCTNYAYDFVKQANG